MPANRRLKLAFPAQGGVFRGDINRTLRRASASVPAAR
jgi:hypothetical protein